MKKLLGQLAGAFLVILGMTGPSVAATYTFSDLANNVNYALVLTPTGAGTYGATFDITGAPTPPSDFFASAFTFKFSGNSSYDITSLTAPAGSTNWSVADYDDNSGVKVLTGGTYKNLLESNKVGFYNQYVSQAYSSQIAGADEVAITSSTDAQFTFGLVDQTGSGSLADLIAFKALYLTNDGSIVQFQGWLSKELTSTPAPVPEPGTLLLLGSGLIGLAGWGRKRFRK